MTERTRRNIDYTLGTFAIEGLRPSKEALHLYELMDEGKLTLKETIDQIKHNHGLTGEDRV